MKKNLLLLVIIITFSACISTSNITPLGNGTYYLTASDKGGVFSADGKVIGSLMNKAQKYCNNINKNAKAIKINRDDEGPMKFESADLIFECN